MKLIVGLGNHPPKYAKTRHNAGFLFLDFLAERYGLEAFREEKKFSALTAAAEIQGTKCLLLKPQTYMNLSGRSVGLAQKFFRLAPEDIFVVYDDIDLPFGTVRFRAQGRSGGHNGIKSLQEVLGTPTFDRLKIGVSNDLRSKVPAEKFVLQHFSPEEYSALLSDVFPAAHTAFLEHFAC